MAKFTGTNGDDTLPPSGADNSGDDIFDPLLGNDNVDGGDGNDVLRVNYASAGKPSNGIVSFVSFYGSPYFGNYNSSNGDFVNFSNIEQFNVTGTKFDDTISGGEGNDTLKGGYGNDTIDGRGGIDRVDGGAGVDTLEAADFSNATTNLMLDDTGNTQIALADGSSISGIEVFSRVRTGSGNDRISFSQPHNNYDIDTGNGNDTINPGLGYDEVDGGDGTDVLVVNYDTADSFRGIVSSFSYSYRSGYFGNYDSGSNRVSFSNIDQFNVTGTKFDDTLLGGEGNDTFKGGYGDDSIYGGRGIDQVDGGAGVDTLTDANFFNATTNLVLDDIGNTRIALADGTSISGIEVFQHVHTGSGNDRINFSQQNENYIRTGSGNDTINSGLGYDNVDGGDGTDVLVVNYATAGGYGGINAEFDYVNGSSYSGNYYNFSGDYVSFSNIERFNVTGTNEADDIFGGMGNDTFKGGYGNDSIDNGGGIDQIDGGAGVDFLAGANLSSATTNLVVDDTGNTRIALANGTSISGIEVFYAVQTGSGNDQITFSQENENYIVTGSGNDMINSGLGYDAVDGGDGTDVLIVNYANAGISAGGIHSDVSVDNGSAHSGLYDGGNSNRVEFRNIERFNVTGTNEADDLLGGVGSDTLDGQGGMDTLNGGAGIDSLMGGDGDDIYIVDSTTDKISETATGGVDTVQSDVSYTLGTNLENLTLAQTSAVNGIGNTLDNVLIGNSAANILNGGAGNDNLVGGLGDDTLTGSAGVDYFRFNTPTEGMDTIADFVAVNDTITVSATGFGGGLVANHSITAALLISGADAATATNATVRFIYNTSNGALFFDADGNGTESEAVHIATLTGKPSISNSDIYVVA